MAVSLGEEGLSFARNDSDGEQIKSECHKYCECLECFIGGIVVVRRLSEMAHNLPHQLIKKNATLSIPRHDYLLALYWDSCPPRIYMPITVRLHQNSRKMPANFLADFMWFFIGAIDLRKIIITGS